MSVKRVVIAGVFLGLLALAAYQWYLLAQTPVKLIICSPSPEHCFVFARFKDLESCDRVDRRYLFAERDGVKMQPRTINCILN
jgi:hypothetical protein